MKMKLLLIPAMSAALVLAPVSVRADEKDTDVKDTDVKTKAQDKTAAAKTKAHDKICQGHHGDVTAKTDTTITIDGKMYALTADSRVNKQEEPVLLKTVKIGDHVCFVTEKAADGSAQISKLIAIDKDEKVRVREKESDSPSKVEVETPEKNEVK